MRGGTEMFLLNYCRGLKALGHTIDFLVWTETPYMEQYVDLEAGIYRITAKHENIVEHIRCLNRFFREHNGEYDVFWDNMNLMSNIDYVKTAKKYGIKKIIVHGHSAGAETGILKLYAHKLNKFFIRRYSTDFWCCSKEAGKFFFDIPGKSANYRIINNAIHVEAFSFQNSLRDKLREKYGVCSKFVLGSLGRLSPAKNPYFILKAYEKCRKLIADAVLVLVGDGPLEEEMKKYVVEKRIPDVLFLGYQNEPAVFYNMFDVFLMPSLHEGFGITAIEAQTNGLPCLMSDKIPNYTFVTKLAEALPIKEGDIEIWGRRIVEKWEETDSSTCSARKGWSQKIKNAGFDLETEIPKLERLMVE